MRLSLIHISFTGKKQTGFSETFLNGYLVLFTVMEILTLPMTVMKMPLHVLTAAWGGIGIVPVSYTQLDVYKRQGVCCQGCF